MSMLAERKTKASWVLNPRGSDWSKDQNKLGQKMLEKMGWSAGKGLGAREQGPVEAIRVAYKGDSRGFGAGRKKEREDWLQQQESFQSLLEGLNGTTDRSVKVKSLEEKSKTTRTKIHYHKFARGKDISRYSEKDLSCIVGSGFVPLVLPDAEPTPETNGVASGSSAGDESLEPSPEDEDMLPQRSRTGRTLKPSAKVAAILEEQGSSLPDKLNTKVKPQKKEPLAETSKSVGKATDSNSTEPAPTSLKKKKPKGTPAQSAVDDDLEPIPTSPKKKKTKGKRAQSGVDDAPEPAPTSPKKKKTKGIPAQSDDDASEPTPALSKKNKAKGKPAQSAVDDDSEPAPTSPKKKKAKGKPAQSAVDDDSEPAPTSPKKKKAKGKPAQSALDDASESTNGPKDQEQSRSVRAYKATALATALEEELPPPKTKKTKVVSKKLTSSDSEPSGSTSKTAEAHSKRGREPKLSPEEETSPSPAKKKTKGITKANSVDNTTLQKDGAHTRSGREHKPTAKALESLAEGLLSPKKKIAKEAAANAQESCSLVQPASVDHSHSRSGREYKPSARMMETLEQDKESQLKSPSKNKDPSKKQKIKLDAPAESNALPKSSKMKASSNGIRNNENVGQNSISPVRQSSRKRVSSETEDVAEKTEPSKVAKSKKKVKKQTESEPPASGSDVNASDPSLPKRKNRKNADETVSDGVPSKKKTKHEKPLTSAKEYSRRKAEGRREDVIRVDLEAAEPASSKRKKKRVEEAHQNGETSISLASSSVDENVDPEHREDRRSKRKKNNLADVHGEEEVGEAKEASSSTLTKRGKKKGVKEAPKGDDEEAAEPTEGENKVAVDVEASKDVDGNEEGHANPTKRKKKAKKLNDDASKDSDDDDEEAASSKTKRRKNKNAKDTEEEASKTEGKTKVTKPKKNKQTPGAKLARAESSESQDTAASGKDSRDTEELSSINSNSSLINEMIGSANPVMEVGTVPEELQKYSILVSDSDDDADK